MSIVQLFELVRVFLHFINHATNFADLLYANACITAIRAVWANVFFLLGNCPATTVRQRQGPLLTINQSACLQFPIQT